MDLWVFAYGSLMWRPGFPFLEAVPARLDGHHRAFCVYSVHYRGTPERPGLVLGLDRGGACEGIAYRVAAEHRHEVVAYLRQRELIYGVYREARLEVALRDGTLRHVRALTYTAERAHPSYAGRPSLRATISIIRNGHGSAGSNVDYLMQTWREIEARGIRDPRLWILVTLAGSPSLLRTGPHALRHPMPLKTKAGRIRMHPAKRFSKVALQRFGYRARLMGR